MRPRWSDGKVEHIQPFTRRSEVYAFHCKYGIHPPFIDDIVASICLGEAVIESVESMNAEIIPEQPKRG